MATTCFSTLLFPRFAPAPFLAAADHPTPLQGLTTTAETIPHFFDEIAMLTSTTPLLALPVRCPPTSFPRPFSTPQAIPPFYTYPAGPVRTKKPQIVAKPDLPNANPIEK
ncbi:hypothetical protein B0H14DRAFT_2592469 [Mycena olivaceomarginata]|nr:hypothetical protein B0H14DRAFT_2592469 [Mycena olivaceomarginata]